MKGRKYAPEVPGTAIALVAMLLGFMAAESFMASNLARENLPASVGASFHSAAAVGIVAFTLVALIFLRSQADKQSRMDRDLLEAFLLHIPANVFFKDRNSRFVRISRAMSDYFGMSDSSMAVGKTDDDIFSSVHAREAFADEQEIIRTGRPMAGKEERETWPDGSESWVLTTKVPLTDYRGRIIGTMGIAQDITDRKNADKQIHHMALHDALTGLPNRTLLQDCLAQAIQLARGTEQHVAVLMLDLDRFKFVNDSFGHHAGDLLLETVSARLKGSLRESDIVARLGGDEFVIALPSVAGNQEVEQVAQKILETLSEPFQIEGHTLRISASIGIAQHPVDAENPADLLKTADAAMYQAKAQGRGIYRFYQPGMMNAARNPSEESSVLEHCSNCPVEHFLG
jgi:diguanylate cyclase (GGDEF)-like protein/PAS domain S-box-containing protein